MQLKYAAHTTNQAPATDCDERRVDIRQLLGNFNAAGSLSRNDLGIVIRRDIEHAVFRRELPCMLFGVETICAEESNLARARLRVALALHIAGLSANDPAVVGI